MMSMKVIMMKIMKIAACNYLEQPEALAAENVQKCKWCDDIEEIDMD